MKKILLGLIALISMAGYSAQYECSEPNNSDKLYIEVTDSAVGHIAYSELSARWASVARKPTIISFLFEESEDGSYTTTHESAPFKDQNLVFDNDILEGKAKGILKIKSNANVADLTMNCSRLDISDELQIETRISSSGSGHTICGYVSGYCAY